MDKWINVGTCDGFFFFRRLSGNQTKQAALEEAELSLSVSVPPRPPSGH